MDGLDEIQLIPSAMTFGPHVSDPMYQIAYWFIILRDLISSALNRSDDQDLIVPFRHGTFTNEPSNLIESNPSSICLEELLQISPILSKSNPKLSGSCVRGSQLINLIRIKTEIDF
jgi:hypothetical protein